MFSDEAAINTNNSSQIVQHPSTETFVDDSDYKRPLFQQPRDLNRIIKEPTYSERYKYIQHQREPSPVGRRPIFKNGAREDTKGVGQSIPQINLSKPSRAPVGCQSPIQSARRQLFEKPRQIFHDDVEGSKPRSYERNGENVIRDSSTYTIPNQPRLFQNQSREIMKYQDVQGSKPKVQIDTNKPEHDIFYQTDRERKKLFDQPRDWVKLPSQQGPRRISRDPPKEPENPEENTKQLFQTPRETMKYQDVEGSKPTQFYPTVPKKPSPTFASHDLFF